MKNRISTCLTYTLLAGTLASSFLSLSAQKSQPELAASVSSLTGKPKLVTDTASGWHARQGAFYRRNWGVDIVDVRRVASGEMLAFRYVVLDPEKAKALNDKRNPAFLIDEASGTKFAVPQMEKVGTLRTTATPRAGRMYWMLFGNTGNVVKVGSRVDVVIGSFRVNGLTVDSK